MKAIVKLKQKQQEHGMRYKFNFKGKVTYIYSRYFEYFIPLNYTLNDILNDFTVEEIKTIKFEL